jgi:hypothetical protein
MHDFGWNTAYISSLEWRAFWHNFWHVDCKYR